MSLTGIMCGYESERKIAERFPESLCAVSGAKVALARARAEELVRQGAKRLLSFGLAGALAPDLEPGDLIVATRVIAGTESWEVDSAFHAELMRGVRAAQCGAVVGSDVVVADPLAKRALFETTQAIIVDMESHCVAEVAARHGIPFCVLRVISDAQSFAIPTAATGAIDAEGRTKILPVLKNLLRTPGQLGGLISLGRHSGGALKSLGEAVERIRGGA